MTRDEEARPATGPREAGERNTTFPLKSKGSSPTSLAPLAAAVAEVERAGFEVVLGRRALLQLDLFGESDPPEGAAEVVRSADLAALSRVLSAGRKRPSRPRSKRRKGGRS